MFRILSLLILLFFSIGKAFGTPKSGSFEGVNVQLSNEKGRDTSKILWKCPVEGVNVQLSNEKGLEVLVDGERGRGFFVGIPPEGSLAIDPIGSHDGEIRVAYTGFIRDQRVAKIEVIPHFSRLKKEIRFRIAFEGRDANLDSSFRTPPSNDPFERLLSRTLINYPVSRKWRKSHEGEAGLLGDSPARYKIIVQSAGIYRVARENLIQAGIGIGGVDPRTLRLENRGVEVPIYFRGEEDGTFDEEDYFEFYGLPPRGEATYFDLYTRENVYFLSWGGGLGARLVEEEGGLRETDPLKVHDPSSFENILHFEVDQLFEGLTQRTADSTDPWFWKLLTTEGQGVTSTNLFFPSPDPSSEIPISYRMMFHGVSYDSDPLSMDHHLLAYLNGTLLGDTEWDEQSPNLFQGLGHPNRTLKKGENLLTLVLDSPESDAILLNWIEFGYQRLYEAHEDSITFSIPKNGEMGLYQFTLRGFTSREIDIYKLGISRIVNFQVEPRVSGGDTTYDALFQDEVFSENIIYVALSSSRKNVPSKILRDTPSDLRSPNNSAELLIITHEKFVGAYGNPSLEDYVSWREGLGVQVSLVKAEDIYDEFNDGILSPQSIKEFLIYAYENWNSPPFYLLLVGDGTWDYRNIRGHGGNLIPSFLQREGNFGWVSVDNEYAAVSGEDFLPDLFVGRIPAREVGELEAVLEKVMRYEGSPLLGEWRRKFIFAAGSGARKNISFRQVFEDSLIPGYLPPFPLPIRIYADRDPNMSPDPFYGRRDELINAINGGGAFVGYFGHGGGAVWSNPYLLTNDDLPLLNNRDRLPFVSSFTCFTAVFDEPSFESLGEGLLKRRDAGAIAVWGSTGGSFFDSGLWIAQSFMNTLFSADTQITLGEIVVGAKLDYAGRITFRPDEEKTVLDVYTLLGDPIVTFGLAERELSLDLLPPSLNPEDTLMVTGLLGEPLAGNAKVGVYYDTLFRDRLLEERIVPVANGNFTLSIPLPDTLPRADGRVRVYFLEASGGRDFVGGEVFQIGDPIFLEIKANPETPLEGDTVHIFARVMDSDGIDSLVLQWSLHNPGFWVDVMMIPLGGDTFRTFSPIPAQGEGTFVYYQATAYDSLGFHRTSREHHYRVPLRADLKLPTPLEIALGGENIVTLSARILNAGETKVDQGGVEFFRRTFSGDSLIGSLFLDIPPRGSAMAVIPWTLPQDLYSIFLRLDSANLIPEMSDTNNSNEFAPVFIEVDRFNVTVGNGTNGEVGSFDGNVRAIIPSQAVSKNTVLVFQPVGVQNFVPLQQPDLKLAPLPSLPLGGGYHLFFGDSSIVFLPGMGMTSRFLFDPSDSTYDRNRLAIYLLEEKIERWVRLGGTLYSDTIEISTSSSGLFTLMINGDDLPPLVEVKVEGQTFANGDYVPSKPVLSAVFQDLNGIDLFLNTFQVFLNGNMVPPLQITYPIKPENPNSVPLSYLPDLGSGSHRVRFEGYDLNGNLGSQEIQFQVIPEFQILKAGCYPNPVRTGNAVITFTLTDRAEEADLRIYTSSGRLVRTFDWGRWGSLQQVGYHEVEWDLLDREGGRVGNGIYFVQIRVRKGEERISKMDKLAILR